MTRRLSIVLAVLSLALPAVAAWNWWADAMKGAAQRQASGPWTPPQQSALQIWYDGFTVAMTNTGIITDSSGNGYNAYQPTASKRGVITPDGAIVGNGSTTTWALTNKALSLTAVSAVAIAKPATAGNKQFLSLSDYAAANWDMFRVGYYASGGTRAMEGRTWHDTAAADTVFGPTLGIGDTNAYSLAAAAYDGTNVWQVIVDTNNVISITAPAARTFSANVTNSTFMSYFGTYFSDNTVRALLVYNQYVGTNDLMTIKKHYMGD